MPRSTLRLAVAAFALLLVATTVVSPRAVTAAAAPTVTAISAGWNHTCALLVDHTIRCWGHNAFGQLGDGTGESSLTPVAVSGIGTATAISVGENHTCAVLADRTVRCWGENSSGQLGDGSTTDRLDPVAVFGISTATAVSAGSGYTCAVLADGAARCWGRNYFGRLGNGTSDYAPHPIPVAVFGISTATAISAGWNHTCAGLADGTLRCWGDNVEGQLGDGTQTSRLTPVAVSGISTATAISVAGGDHTCALLADHTSACWGNNFDGQLGDGTTTDRFIPVKVSGISSATAISAGESYTCALLASGSARCWGANPSGPLGDGTSDYDPHPIPVAVSGISTATAIAAAATGIHTCAALADGTAWCWGYNDHGELGDGTMTTRLTPVEVVFPAPPTPFTDIAGSSFKADIEWLYDSGITKGCSATLFCPDASVTRGQMAAFLDRALSLPSTTTDFFTDDNGTTFEANINRLAASGITKGCTATTFCPTATVTRGQMAAFLDRAFALPATTTDFFTDDNGTTFEANINRLAASGITTGCSATTYCPTAEVTRGQMAAFLHRALTK